MGVNSDGNLQSVYWGARLGDTDILPAPVAVEGNSTNEPSYTVTPFEYAGFGGGLTTEPSLKVGFPDGVRDLQLRYVNHQIYDQELVIQLRDLTRAVHVYLRYSMDPESGILRRSASIYNMTDDWVQIDAFAAASINLPYNSDYHLSYLTGRWAGEWTLQKRAVTPGSIVIESRRGSTSHQANPWFALSRSETGENAGEVWYGALAWSGSWRISVDVDAVGAIRTTAGYNPFDFSYRLRSGEHLTSPMFYAGFSNRGFGDASRLFHHYQRTYILPRSPVAQLRRVMYNSWEATGFAVDEAGQMALAKKAARIGIERFVLDDGWFGARHSADAGLGDWLVNPQKFPEGLGPLIRCVNNLGMEFGLWVEPEMVNPDSDLYRKHPDWVMNFPERPRTEARNQLVLNLARDDVYDFLFATIDELLVSNDIDFLKWDYNRNWSEPGWPEVSAEDQPRIYIDYVDNLYRLLAELRQRHPKLEIESCASGGGRVDLGILKLTDQVWTSDNTDPYDRLLIQDGFSYAYAPAVMMAWVTDTPNFVNRRVTSLEYRFLSAMQGGLGIGADLNRWTEEDFARATELIEHYKSIRATVLQGDLYRLVSPREGSSRSATLSVSQDRQQAVLFVFLHSSFLRAPQARIQLRGLASARIYRLRVMVGEGDPHTPAAASGAYWMGYGLKVHLSGDFQAAGFVFDAMDEGH